MKKVLMMVLALMVMAVFSFGCATVDKEAKVKCPKCGAVFSVQEGIDQYNRK